jgi:hypothetical protein
MRHILQTLPGVVVLAIGTILVLWGGYYFIRGPQPEPVTPNDTPRFCAPTVLEMFGMEPGGERFQGLLAMGVGSVAVLLAVSSLGHKHEVS